MHLPSLALRRRAASVVTPLLLAVALSGCSEVELAVGEAQVESSSSGTPAPSTAPSGAPSAAPFDPGPTSAAPATVVAADDPELEASVTTVGPWLLRLPTGWAALEGAPGAASGGTSTVIGAATSTSAAAAGKDRAAWVAELLAGTTDLVAEREGLVEEPSVVLADGTEVFHLVHTYSDNRAHLFGVLQGDALHLLRFGLDGSPETAAVVVKAVSTAFVLPEAPAAG